MIAAVAAGGQAASRGPSEVMTEQDRTREGADATSPRTGRRSTTTICSRRSRPGSCCSGPRSRRFARPRQPARQLRARRGRRGLPLQRQHQPVQPSRLRRPRAAAPPQAAAAPRRDPQADREDGRKGHDARARPDVFQERPGEGRGQPGERQEGLRQARDDQTPRDRSRDPRRDEAPALKHD